MITVIERIEAAAEVTSSPAPDNRDNKQQHGPVRTITDGVGTVVPDVLSPSEKLAKHKKESLKAEIVNTYNALLFRRVTLDDLLLVVKKLLQRKVNKVDYDYRESAPIAKTADDWVQDVWIAIWRNITEFASDPENDGDAFYHYVNAAAAEQVATAKREIRKENFNWFWVTCHCTRMAECECEPKCDLIKRERRGKRKCKGTCMCVRGRFVDQRAKLPLMTPVRDDEGNPTDEMEDNPLLYETSGGTGRLDVPDDVEGVDRMICKFIMAGFDYARIAEEMDMSVGAVAQRVHQMKKLNMAREQEQKEFNLQMNKLLAKGKYREAEVLKKSRDGR